MGTHTTLLGYRELWRIVFYENYIDESISLVHWRVAMAFDFSKIRDYSCAPLRY